MSEPTQDQKNGLSAIGKDRSKAGIRRNARQLQECDLAYTLALQPLEAWTALNPVVSGEPAWKARARQAIVAATTLSNTSKTNERAAITARLASN